MKFCVTLFLVFCTAPCLASGWSGSNYDGDLNTQAGDDSDNNQTGLGFCSSVHSTDSAVYANADNTRSVDSSSASADVDLSLGSGSLTSEYCDADGWTAVDITNDGNADTVDVSVSVSFNVDSYNESYCSCGGSAWFGNVGFEWVFSGGTLHLDYYNGSTWFYDVDTDSSGSNFSVSYTASSVNFAANSTETMDISYDMDKSSSASHTGDPYGSASIDVN